MESIACPKDAACDANYQSETNAVEVSKLHHASDGMTEETEPNRIKYLLSPRDTISIMSASVSVTIITPVNYENRQARKGKENQLGEGESLVRETKTNL